MRLRHVALLGGLIAATPVGAQEINARVGKLESEMRAVQRRVFPGGPGASIEPDIRAPDASAGPAPGTPASSPVADLSQRVSALEAQMATMTGDIEQNSHRLRVLEDGFAAYKRATDARLAAATAPPPAGADALYGAGDANSRSGDDDAPPARRLSGHPRPAPLADTAVDSAVPPVSGRGRSSQFATADADAPPARAAAPKGDHATRLAAVDKPDTGDAPEDSYLYGYRLYQAKLYPEAETQLKQVVATYPKSKRASYAQNLLGRSYLEEGKPSLASIAFYDNYKKMPDGDRAPDSLYYLAQSLMKLNKPADACKVYAELGDVYAAKITPEMKANVAKGRAAAKCG